ncbi:prealbumin-like fold domain-containing protein [Streptomyces uncialis]|uniref:MSCRAMM family protein n=1 Tax=Streptomyces uncialis TaxID=1048205 RepID=UPI002E351FDD|nr:prealbumin-like fold domain-containing protein [Streptomyces uncialis]
MIRIRPARRRRPGATVAAATVGMLACAPTASAEPTQPSPSSSPSASQRDEPETPATGGIALLKKDTGGDVLAGASFALLDDTGKGIADGKTDAAGRLAFADLPAGVYRLKETSSGSPLHDVVADQDVIVTPGTTIPLTITDPFKPAALTLKATDRHNGKPLPGAVVNITTARGGGTITLTTGRNGTATATLPVTSRTGTPYTATQTAAPAGYRPGKPVKLTARPATSLIAAFANTRKQQPAKPPTSPPAPTPSATPPIEPSDTPRPDTLRETGTAASASVPATRSPARKETTPAAEAPAAKGELARTGADTIWWLLGGAGALLAAGGGAVIAVHRRRADDGPVRTSGWS